jgi:hypothetical protein
VKSLLCALIFLVLTVEDDNFARGRFHTVMYYAQPVFKGNPLNLWDVLFGLVALSVVLRPAGRRAQVGSLNRVLFASAAMLLGMVVWGGLRGGDLRMAYFQLFALLRMFVMTPVLAGVFRSTRDLRLLAGTVLAGALYRALACLLSVRLALMRDPTLPWPSDITGHDDSAVWAATVIGLLAWLLVHFRARTALVVGAMLPLLFVAIYYNQRRLAWMELVWGIPLAYLTIPRGPLRRRLNRVLVCAAPVLILYVAAGWGRPGLLFAPVEKMRSMIADKNNASNLSRDLENMGLVLTLQGHRFLGTGFGHEYEEVSTVYSKGMSILFAHYRYVPHNSVLGLVAFTGMAGFPVIWCFLSVGGFLAARARRFAWRPAHQALSTTAFAAIFIYTLQAYGDMGILSLKVNLLLACALAMAARLAILTGAWPNRLGAVSDSRAAARPVPRTLIPAVIPTAARFQAPWANSLPRPPE